MASLKQLTTEKVSHQPIPLYRDINSQRSVKLDLNSLCIKRPTDTFLFMLKTLI